MTERAWLRRGGRLVAALAVVAAGVLALPGSVDADPPTFFGWWTSTNPGVTLEPIPTVVPPGGGPYGTPSDVPAGGFEVANVPGDTSVAAIGYTTGGATVTQVVLQQAPNTASLPGSTVQACLLSGTGIFTPASAAPINQAPPYDANRCAPGVADASSGSVSFPVSDFVHDDYLGVAIVAVGTSRIVFNQPDQNTVKVATPVPASDLSGFDASSLNASPSASDSSSSAFAPSPNVGSADLVAAPSPATAPPSATAAPAPQGPAPAPPKPTLVAVTQPTKTIGVGSAVVGALLVLALAVFGLGRGSRMVVADPTTDE